MSRSTTPVLYLGPRLARHTSPQQKYQLSSIFKNLLTGQGCPQDNYWRLESDTSDWEGPWTPSGSASSGSSSIWSRCRRWRSSNISTSQGRYHSGYTLDMIPMIYSKKEAWLHQYHVGTSTSINLIKLTISWPTWSTYHTRMSPTGLPWTSLASSRPDLWLETGWYRIKLEHGPTRPCSTQTGWTELAWPRPTQSEPTKSSPTPSFPNLLKQQSCLP